jgi:hypothetical protein
MKKLIEVTIINLLILDSWYNDHSV